MKGIIQKVFLIIVLSVLLVFLSNFSSNISMQTAKVFITGGPSLTYETCEFIIKSDGTLEVTVGNYLLFREKDRKYAPKPKFRRVNLSTFNKKEINRLISEIKENSNPDINLSSDDVPHIFVDIDGQTYRACYAKYFPQENDEYVQNLAYRLVRISPIKTGHGRQNSQHTSYIMSKTVDGVQLEFFSKDGRKIFCKEYVKEPNIQRLNKNLYKIIANSGANSNYTVFIDIEKSEISEPYFNLLSNDEDIVAFMKEKTIFLKDIFDDGVYATISRNFSNTAVPQASILLFEMSHDVIYLKYLEGENYDERNEQINVR